MRPGRREGLLRTGCLSAAGAQAVSQPGRRPVRRRRPPAPASTIRPTRRWASPSSTTTWTAGRICSSAATACRPSSIATMDTAASSKTACGLASPSARTARRAPTWAPMPADYDRSGRPHIVVGNFYNEMLGLYHNENGERFVDVAPRSPVGRASLLNVTWGLFFLDYDLDGFLDIFAANGGTDSSEGMDKRARLSQAPLLLRNNGNGSFADVTSTLGPAFNRTIMGRGAAYADFDGDGDLDLTVATLAGPAYLFRNDGGNRNNWLRVRVVGSKSNRSGLGTVVRVTTSSGTQMQTVHSGSSYASQSELTLTFGLGHDARAAKMTTEWPSGKVQSFSDLLANQFVTIDEERGSRSSR